MADTIIPVILCGGSGTRLWPASRENHPKQFLNLVDDFSLLQNTMQRALRITNTAAEKLVTVTLDSLAEEVASHASEVDVAAANHILCEPSARNTAAAIAFAAAYIEETFGADTFMWILPADHHIGNEKELKQAADYALSAAKQNFLVTFGIQPHRPETGYGYIKIGKQFSGSNIHQAEAFMEKPDAKTAQSFIDSKNYLWNSGMFFFSTSTLLDEYRKHSPHILSLVRNAIASAENPREADGYIYAQIPEQPFDKEIMEKSDRVAVIPCDPSWSDIGSWESLWEMRPKDDNGNVVQGHAACHETSNCLIQANTRLIACAGLENIVVIETPDALLIADRRNSDAMRALVKTLKSAGYAEVINKPYSAWIKPEQIPTNIHVLNPRPGAHGIQGAA
jgi:mannose-1-phosphate guanylyltransferase/mannose-6-phosphate isomerase